MCFLAGVYTDNQDNSYYQPPHLTGYLPGFVKKNEYLSIFYVEK